jgi:Fe2+ transport system protein FeoA
MLSLSDREERIPEEGKGKRLSAVETGKKAYIVAVDSGQGLKGRLAAMGLVPGVPVDVILNSPRGPFILAIKGSRVMLGRGMAAKIIVV